MLNLNSHFEALKDLQTRFKSLLDVLEISDERLEEALAKPQLPDDTDFSYRPPSYVDLATVPQSLPWSLRRPPRVLGKKARRRKADVAKKRRKVN